MKREASIIQIVSLIVIVLLGLTFYLLLTMGTNNLQSIITPLILIVIAVICLATLSVLARMEELILKKK